MHAILIESVRFKLLLIHSVILSAVPPLMWENYGVSGNRNSFNYDQRSYFKQ
jgi:hypothetical protein